MINTDVQKIFKQFEGQLIMVEEELRNIFKSDSVLIPLIGSHLIEKGGKRLRPLFLILCAEIAGYKDKERLVLASVIEAIHTASLLHDDVVDGADTRRGSPASHSIWGNQTVILVGDFIYAHALALSVAQKNLAIIEALAQSIMKMTEGELIQLQKSGDPDIAEADYLTIIAYKTGSLFSTACKIGGLLGSFKDKELAALTQYGLKAGVAFQIYDDILDFEADEEELGKSLGKDLDEGKITLPLIYLLEIANADEKKEITDLIIQNRNHKNPQLIEKDLKRMLKLFAKYNIIDKAMDKAKSIVESARNELSVFPDSPQKDALFVMTDYCLQRKK
ncbi:MAG: polyprenyl synthetase family protein [Nitrospirae bacterium]|nr:polyprenyl synthetase family protein [Nitrospirota bacterium]